MAVKAAALAALAMALGSQTRLSVMRGAQHVLHLQAAWPQGNIPRSFRRLKERGRTQISPAMLRGNLMTMPPPDPDVADKAPADSLLTPYDHEHAITYLRLLDADAEGADWKEVAPIVLHIDPEREPVRARQAYESHLIRARWMTKQGYRLLLKNGWPEVN